MDRETVMIVGNTKDAAEFIDGKYDSVGRSGRRSCRRCLVGNAAVVGVRVGDEHIGSITVHHGLGRRGMAVLVIHDIFYDVDDGCLLYAHSLSKTSTKNKIYEFK